MICRIQRQNIKSGERGPSNVMLLHYGSGSIGIPMSTSEEEDQVCHAVDMAARGHPFIRHRQWVTRAKDARFRRGDYEEAVWALQVAVELLLAGIVRSTAIDEGLTDAEVESRVEDWTSPFKSLVTRRVPDLLGGSWDISRDDQAVGKYWSDLYLLRSRSTHGGRPILAADMERASSAYGGLIDFVCSRVVKRQKRYPRTALALLGQPGLEERSAWTSAIEAFASGLNEEPYPFWQAWDVVGRPDPRRASEN